MQKSVFLMAPEVTLLKPAVSSMLVGYRTGQVYSSESNSATGYIISLPVLDFLWI